MELEKQVWEDLAAVHRAKFNKWKLHWEESPEPFFSRMMSRESLNFTLCCAYAEEAANQQAPRPFPVPLALEG